MLLLLLNAEEKETAETKMITFIFFKLLSQFIHQHAHKTTQHKSFYCNARHGIIFIFANVKHWLDPTKTVKKQIKIGPPYTLHLKVKFYSSEPNTLREELTRYQFFLQLKQDILTGRLEVPEPTIYELCALALQCK